MTDTPEVVAVPKTTRGVMTTRARTYYEDAAKVADRGQAIRVRVNGFREECALRDAIRRLARLDGRRAHTHTSGGQMTIWVDAR